MEKTLKELNDCLDKPQIKEKAWWKSIYLCLVSFRNFVEKIFASYYVKLDEKKSLMDNAIARDQNWKQIYNQVYIPFSKTFKILQNIIFNSENLAKIREEKNDVRIVLKESLNDLENIKKKFESDSLMFLAIQEKKNPNVFSIPEGVVILTNSNVSKRISNMTQAMRKKHKKENYAASIDMFQELKSDKTLMMSNDSNDFSKINIQTGNNNEIDPEIKYWIIENHDVKNFSSCCQDSDRKNNLYIKRIRYCPKCPNNVQMEYLERPPSICCPKCSLCIDDLDITSPFVHEKEAPNHTPSSYHTKVHFKSTVSKILGKCKIFIPEEEEKDLMLVLRLQINNKGIKKVEDVTWSLVRCILSDLAKKTHPKYKDFYPCVYQLTNALRGKPVLTLTDKEEEEIYKIYDEIDNMWPKLKEDLDLDRSNSMGTIIQLQLIFYLLDYPSQINDMFNEMKGDDKEKEYDQIIKSICQKFEKRVVCTEELCNYNNKKVGGNIFLEALEEKKNILRNNVPKNFFANDIGQIVSQGDELI
jgi:hypothetical protein